MSPASTLSIYLVVLSIIAINKCINLPLSQTDHHRLLIFISSSSSSPRLRITRSSPIKSIHSSSRIWLPQKFIPLNQLLCGYSNNNNCPPCPPGHSVGTQFPPANPGQENIPVIDPDLLPPGYSFYPPNYETRSHYYARSKHRPRSSSSS